MPKSGWTRMDVHRRILPILGAAVVADLKADADELAKLFAELNERERERLLVLLFGSDQE